MGKCSGLTLTGGYSTRESETFDCSLSVGRSSSPEYPLECAKNDQSRLDDRVNSAVRYARLMALGLLRDPRGL